MDMYCGKLSGVKGCSDRCYVFFRKPHDPRGDLLFVRSGRRSEKYRVWEAYPGDPEGRGWRLEKASDGAVYTVYLHGNGQDRSCDCPDAVYRSRDCKHLEVVRDLLTLGAFDPADPADSPLFDGSPAFGGV